MEFLLLSQVTTATFAPEDATEWINYVIRRRVAGRHGMQHRAKDNGILATDQRDREVPSFRNCGIELLHRIQIGKPTTGDHVRVLSPLAFIVLGWISVFKVTTAAIPLAAKLANRRAILAADSYGKSGAATAARQRLPFLARHNQQALADPIARLRYAARKDQVHAQTFSRPGARLKMRSQLLSELKIDMLNTSIGSCERRRRRKHFRGFARRKPVRLNVFIVDSFHRTKTHTPSRPARTPTNGLSNANQSESRHSIS